jgi:hypothetical protein
VNRPAEFVSKDQVLIGVHLAGELALEELRLAVALERGDCLRVESDRAPRPGRFRLSEREPAGNR